MPHSNSCVHHMTSACLYWNSSLTYCKPKRRTRDISKDLGSGHFDLQRPGNSLLRQALWPGVAKPHE
eukprot:3820703-Amphidinium_carterae.1